MSEIQEKNKINETDEIDIIEIFKSLKAGRKTIYRVVAVFFVIGLIMAFGTPKQYKSETTLLIETASKNGMSGLLQQFGGLAGLNLGSGSEQGALNPELYPYVIKSVPFLLEVMDMKVTESKYDSTLILTQYLDRHTKFSVMGLIMGYTVGLPGKIIGWIKGKSRVEDIPSNRKGPFRLTQKQFDMAKGLIDCIKTREGDAKGTLVISVEMQDPLVAAQLTDSVVKCLTKYVIDYHTQKAKIDQQFIADRHNEAKAKYVYAQRALAVYRDQNKNVILASAKSEEERLQAEYNLAFNVFNTLSQQLEQAKIKVQEETPVFKVLEPAQVPLQKYKPKTSLVLISMLLFGGIVGIGIIISRIIYRNFLIYMR